MFKQSAFPDVETMSLHCVDVVFLCAISGYENLSARISSQI